MKSITWIISIIVCCFILVGCSNDTAKLEEENNEQGSYQPKSPPGFDISNGEMGKMTRLDKYYWESEDKSCSIEPSDVEETLEGSKPLSAEKGQEITFRQNIEPERLEFPHFDQITITQIRLQEETEVEFQEDRFLAPEEPGKYYYLVHLKWTNERVGEAYYAFALSVR